MRTNNLDKDFSCLEYFRKVLQENVKNDTRVAEIIDVMDAFGQYAYENRLIACNIFSVNDLEILKTLLKIVKIKADTRKRFRGKLVLLESGLINYISLVENKKISNGDWTCNRGEVEIEEENLDSLQIQNSMNPINYEKEIAYTAKEDNLHGRFVSWCRSKTYKENTIKGFISSLHMVEVFLKKHKKEIDIWTCDSVEKIETIVTQIQSFSDFKRNAQANYLYALRVYLTFVKDLEFGNRSDKEISLGKIDVSESKKPSENGKNSFEEKREVTNVKQVLKEFPNIGLYIAQLSDMSNVDKDIVTEILEKAPWCRKEGRRFYYNESADEWRNILYENDNAKFEWEDEEECDESSYSKEYDIETINEMLNDPEEFIKARIRNIKGE